MSNILQGGRKHERAQGRLLKHGNPQLANPRGTHGVIQIDASNLDVDAIKAAIRQTFFREQRNPGMNITNEIDFEVMDNGDGTAEVAFEVQD